ncbi:MAG: GNAT family N-acetyltransferase [Bdellovibrionota bacterium]
MMICELSTEHFDSALELCQTLKNHDQHPCSFWGYSKETLAKAISNREQITLVALEKKTIVGLGSLNKGGHFQNHWASISLAVHPSYRKNGIALELAHALEKYIQNLEIEFIKALILENNVCSRRFFEKLGYEHKATLFQDFKIDSHGKLNDCVYYKFFSLVVQPNPSQGCF